MEHDPLLAQGVQTQPKPTVGGMGQLLRTTQHSLLGEGAKEMSRERVRTGWESRTSLQLQCVKVRMGWDHPCTLGMLESFPSLQPPSRITSFSPSLHVDECH